MIEPFQPLTDAGEVFALWQRALGDSYPISERAFWQNTSANPLYQPGDALVARAGDQVIGFCLTRFDVATTTPPQTPCPGSVSVLLVDPGHRRQGLGTELLHEAETHLRRRGVTQINLGCVKLYRFWPGIPTDLTSAIAFFTAAGYRMERRVCDLVRNLADYTRPPRVSDTLAREVVRIRPAADEDVAELLAFERRHFPGWEASVRLLCAVGDTNHLIVVRDHGQIIGSLQSFSPASRYRAANVVWEQMLGQDVGGIGAVGIAEPHRGRGLGLALCAVASQILQQRRVGNCHIDWTGHVDFYGKLGFKTWRQYWMASKQCDPES